MAHESRETSILYSDKEFVSRLIRVSPSIPLSLYSSFSRISSPLSLYLPSLYLSNPVISYLLIPINHLIHHLAFQSQFLLRSEHRIIGDINLLVKSNPLSTPYYPVLSRQ
jgi:hypothetical protein